MSVVIQLPSHVFMAGLATGIGIWMLFSFIKYTISLPESSGSCM